MSSGHHAATESHDRKPRSRAERAAHYHEYAEQIRGLADRESDPRLRDKLSDLARQYAEQAERLEVPP